MKKVITICAAISVAGLAHASLYVVGDLQSENGAADWDPPSGLIMAAGGIYTRTVNNLTDGALYAYKVLDDEGTAPANWGDPEIVNANTWAIGDADGTVVITVNTNLTGPNGNVTWVETDSTPLQVAGNFMDEAGGAGDWNPADPTFDMTPQGSGYYTIDLVIDTAGSYEFKATDGTGWDRQVGTDGFSANAATYDFTTTVANEAVTMFVDTANQSIGVIPEPATMGLICLFGTSLLAARRMFII